MRLGILRACSGPYSRELGRLPLTAPVGIKQSVPRAEKQLGKWEERTEPCNRLLTLIMRQIPWGQGLAAASVLYPVPFAGVDLPARLSQEIFVKLKNSPQVPPLKQISKSALKFKWKSTKLRWPPPKDFRRHLRTCNPLFIPLPNFLFPSVVGTQNRKSSSL